MDELTKEELERISVSLIEEWRSLLSIMEDTRGHSSFAFWRKQADLAESAYLKIKKILSGKI